MANNTLIAVTLGMIAVLLAGILAAVTLPQIDTRSGLERSLERLRESTERLESLR